MQFRDPGNTRGVNLVKGNRIGEREFPFVRQLRAGRTTDSQDVRPWRRLSTWRIAILHNVRTCIAYTTCYLGYARQYGQHSLYRVAWSERFNGERNERDFIFSQRSVNQFVKNAQILLTIVTRFCRARHTRVENSVGLRELKHRPFFSPQCPTTCSLDCDMQICLAPSVSISRELCERNKYCG